MELLYYGPFVLIFIVVSSLVDSSSLMPIRRSHVRKLKRSFLPSSPSKPSPHPGSPQFNHDPSIIQLQQDPVLSALVHHKISENLAIDNAWEPVLKLPDHEVMVGIPVTGQAPPSMHMASSGVTVGSADVMLDTIGGTIVQTFYGKRNPDCDDDDDWNDDFDIDDDDHKKNREEDDDDDDDGKKSPSDDWKERLRSMMAPLIIAPRARMVPSRSAALLHKPVLATHRTPLSRLSYNIPTEQSRKSHPYTSQSRLVVPQHIAKLRSPATGSIGYRLVSSLSVPRQSSGSQRGTIVYRPRVLYD